jgi:hypothetical protein
MVHPTIGWSVDRLLEHLCSAVPYAAIVGTPKTGKAELARRVAVAVGGRFLSLPPRATVVTDRPGSDLPVEIEFLRARSEMLSRQTWGVGDPWSVSDFWLEQSLAYGRARLPPDDVRVLEDELLAAQQASVRPKITVFVETPVSASGDSIASDEANGANAKESASLADELARAAHRRDLGPLVRLSGLDLQQAVRELTATLKGMQ